MVVEIRNLKKTYGKQCVIDDLTFSVGSGQIVGLVGPNGAGKTTTLRVLLGLIKADSGQALIHGQPYVELDQPAKAAGAILDRAGFHPGRTAKGHLAYLAAATGAPQRRIDEVIATVGLTDAANKRIKKFSLGMRQRLGLAGALLNDPDILILDEPANGLDPHGIRWLRDLLRFYADNGKTVLVSSHILSEVEQIVDQVVVIARGKLVAQGTVDELGQGHSEHVRVRTPQLEQLHELLKAQRNLVKAELSPDGSLLIEGLSAAEIGELAAENRVALHELAPLGKNLEDVFMQLTAGEGQQIR